MMEAYWPTAAEQSGATRHDVKHSQWYNGVEKIVLSRRLERKNLKNTVVIHDEIAKEIMQIKQRPGKNILIFGSPGAVRSLLAENLVDEFWFFVNPVVLGKGIPFFNRVKDSLRLKLMSSYVFSSGVVCLQYSR